MAADQKGFAAIVLFIIFARSMLLEIAKALLVGMIAALPLGPIFVMVVQGTLCYRRSNGLLVGYGAAMGDMVYAGVGLLTLELIKSFVLEHQGVFMLVGGVVIGLIGCWMYSREISLDVPEEQRQVSGGYCFLQGFTGALSNPAALAAMLALLTVFQLGTARTPVWALVLLVGSGEALYWTLITWMLKRYLQLGGRTLRFGSKLAGVLVCVFAAVLLVRGCMMIIRN